MNIAFKESLKGLGKTRPNPIVGAVVVKDENIISKGLHQRCGSPHAEVNALNKAGKSAIGADLYVTLEPCCAFGRTPPCTDKIITFGIKRIFVGIKDPNPNNNGKGISILKKAGIKVETGFLQKEIKTSNRIFIKYITEKLPFVTVKIAQSLDGKIATYRKQSQWITSVESRKLAHKLRKDFDAIITGVNTVISDSPRFKEASLKVVVDTKFRIPLNAKIFTGNKVIIATTRLASKKKMALLKAKAEILMCPLKKARVDLQFLLQELAKREISSVLVEAGGELVGSFFDNHLVDRVLFFIAPKIIGGKDAVSSVEGRGAKFLRSAFNLREVKVSQVNSDLLIEGQMKTQLTE